MSGMSALGQKQTCAVHPRMSAECHKRTLLAYSITSSVGAHRENRKGAEGERQP